MAEMTTVAARRTPSAKPATPTTSRLAPGPASRQATPSTAMTANGSATNKSSPPNGASTRLSVLRPGLQVRSSTVLVYAHGSPDELVFQQLDVGIDHERHELGKAHRRLPPQNLFRLGGVPAQMVNFGWSEVTWIDLDILDRKSTRLNSSHIPLSR